MSAPEKSEDGGLFYRLFGFWIRREACRMTAIAMQNHTDQDEICPRAWSLAVFFERYMVFGSEGTHEDFGPKEPVELKAVEPSPPREGER